MSESTDGIPGGSLFEELVEHTSFDDSVDVSAVPETLPELVADAFVTRFATWTAIGVQVALCALWFIGDHFLHYDPYPYGFLALCLTIVGLIATMLVLKAQTRADARLTHIIGELRNAALKEESMSLLTMESQMQILSQNAEILAYIRSKSV